MGIFEILLVSATFLCSLVAGFLFAFSVVVMPGFKTLKDGEFLRAFQAIDQIIQDNHPVFMLVWVGSIICLILTAAFGISALSGSKKVIMISATCIYLACVQFPTIAINIPLNNKIQAIDVQELTEEELETARAEFESPWNRSNQFRTVCASFVSVLLLCLLLQQ